jgi:hypothetical protein
MRERGDCAPERLMSAGTRGNNPKAQPQSQRQIYFILFYYYLLPDR